MGLVAGLTCALCRFLRLVGLEGAAVEVHHRRAGTGGGRRASDFDTIPLCYEHHRGATGIHGLGTKLFARTHETTEADLVEETRTRLGVTAQQIEVWKQAVRDRRRKVSKPARSKKASNPTASATRWPTRKLESRSSFRPRA